MKLNNFPKEQFAILRKNSTSYTKANQLIADVYDHFCDPTNPKSINFEDVVASYEYIKDFIVRTPVVYCHSSPQFEMNLIFKLESLHQSGSFKQRGLAYALQKLSPDDRENGVAIGSLGNAGAALAFICPQLNIPNVVVMPNWVPISRLQRCKELGSEVIVQGSTLAESQRYARLLAKDRNITYINSRDYPELSVGNATMALEILQDFPQVEAVLVPVGTGGLLAGIATVIKHFKPKCLVYGIQPESTPYFTKYFQKNPEDEVNVENQPTIADSLDVTMVGVNSFSNFKKDPTLVDKMVLVPENLITLAIVHMYDREQLVVEGAGACPLAAVMGGLVPELKGKHVVAIVTGGNVDSTMYCRNLQRGMAVDGQLVQIRVLIKDNSIAQTQLLRLLASEGFVVIHQFQTHRWTEGTEYFLEMCLCLGCRNQDHALELKHLMRVVYPGKVEFENNPFIYNPPTKCPCPVIE